MTYRTRTNVSDFPTLHYVVQCFHDLFPRHVVVESMDLQYINIRPQSSYACIDSIEDMLPRETLSINILITSSLSDTGLGFLIDAKIALAQEDDIGSWDLEFT